MGSYAQYFSSPNSIKETQKVFLWAKSKQIPVAILGEGSNSIFSDKPFLGLVISLQNLKKFFWEDENTLFCEAGLTNTEISELILKHNRRDAFWLFRMPGLIGASVRMNARCYGGEMSHITKSVWTIDSMGNLKSYSSADVFLGYKKTLFMESPEIIVGMRLHLPTKGDTKEIRSQMKACEKDRNKKAHFLYPSCGSTFKNNYEIGIPSGQLFDELGFKGKKIGKIGVSEYHANFLFNYGGAKTSDFLALAKEMKETAWKERKAHVELEVQPIGSFTKEQVDGCEMLEPTFLGRNKEKLVGLFWHPSLKHNKISFPNTIFSSSYFDWKKDYKSSASKISLTSLKNKNSSNPDLLDKNENIIYPAQVKLKQLTSLDSAKKAFESPFLEWSVTFPQEKLAELFPLIPSAKGFMDSLWEYSVAECFFAHPDLDVEEYFEFEMTPELQWLALSFKGIRQRKQIFKAESHKKQIKLIKRNTLGDITIGATFSYKILKPYIFHKKIQFLSALSLGEKRFALSHKFQDLKSKPDFHNLELFWSLNLS